MMFDLFNNRSRRRSLVSAAAVTAAVVVALSACSGATPEVEDSATSGSIDWWGWTPEIGVGEQYIELFNEEFPDIEVNYKQVATADYDSVIRPALASNVGPDVFNMAPGGGIGSIQVYEGSAIDLTPAITEALGDDWSSQIAELGPLGLTTEAGKLAALPIGSVFAGPVWINPTIFAEHGLTPPTTYEEWIDVCAKFAAEDQICFELGAGDAGFNQDLLHAIANSIEPGIWSKAVAGDAEWTDPALVQAMTIFEEMFHNGIIQEGAQGMQQYPDVNNDFLSGKTAMVMMGTWYMQYSTMAGCDRGSLRCWRRRRGTVPHGEHPVPGHHGCRQSRAALRRRRLRPGRQRQVAAAQGCTDLCHLADDQRRLRSSSWAMPSTTSLH